MPQADRPSSPEEPSSDQCYIHRLEQDLYELFEEQQLLLDIVAQQQERLEHQLEVRRLLTNEPQVRRATPVPELAAVPLDKLSIGVDAEPEQSVLAVPELLVITEADELAVPSSEFGPQLPDLVVALEPVPEVDIDLFEVAEQRPPTPSTPELEMELQLASHPETPPCELERPETQQLAIPYVHDPNVGKCTPPKCSGLGYDTPFPYPRGMVKSRERRALFIFTLVANLVMHLQRYMGLNAVYIDELEVANPEPPPLAVAGLPTSTGALPKTKPKPKALWKPKPKPKSKPKSKSKSNSNPKSSNMDMTVKRCPTQPAKPLHIYLHKQPKLTAVQLDHEIDLDCEFGMDHISKFRADCVREDEEARQRAMSQLPNQCQMAPIKLADEVQSSESEEQKCDQLSEALASLVISEGSSQSQKKPEVIDWFNQIFTDRPQWETRARTPNSLSNFLMPAVLHIDNYMNPLPSTSAQAQALSMTAAQPFALSMKTASPPIAYQLNNSQMSMADHLDSLTTIGYESSSGDGDPHGSIFGNGDNNTNNQDGFDMPCTKNSRATDFMQSPKQPVAPPPSPVHNQHLNYDSANSKEGKNGPMDFGEE